MLALSNLKQQMSSSSQDNYITCATQLVFFKKVWTLESGVQHLVR